MCATRITAVVFPFRAKPCTHEVASNGMPGVRACNKDTSRLADDGQGSHEEGEDDGRLLDRLQAVQNGQANDLDTH